jgi:hypothetical protein
VAYRLSWPVVDGLGAGASLADVAAALDAIDGINATASGSGIDITITKSASIDLVSTAFDLGGAVAGVGLDFDGQFASKLGADLKVALHLDDATSQLQVLNPPTSEPELKVGLDGSLTLDAEGKLGFLTISATDKDPAKPEVEIDIALDLPTGDAGSLGGATAQVTGRAGLELDIDTKFGTDIPAGILPSITTDLIVDYATLGAVPSIAFNDIITAKKTAACVRSVTLRAHSLRQPSRGAEGGSDAHEQMIRSTGYRPKLSQIC